jgi:hypothetical protein
VRVLSVLSSYLTFVAFDLLVVVASTGGAAGGLSPRDRGSPLWEFLLMEDHDLAMVARIQQGASIAVAAMQLCTG